MTKTIREINDFINQLDQNHFGDDYSNCLNDFLTNDFLEELDQNDPEDCYNSIDSEDCYNSISKELEENGFFDIEFIIYYDAIEYLQENDPSLKESVAIASERGFTLHDINSELLASLLAGQKAIKIFQSLKDEITEFFDD